MAVPSSDRARRPFLLSLSLFLLLSALLVLLFLFLDPSPGTLAFLPSRLAGSAPSLPPPLLPQRENPNAITPPGTGSPPHSQPTAPLAASVAKAEENIEASQPQATTGVEGIGNINSPRADNNSRAPAVEAGGKADTGVVPVGDGDGGGGDGGEVDVAVRWETCSRLGRGVAAADYIPCLDNVRAIKALRSRRHMEHRERHCPVAPRPRCLVPLPAGYRTPLPWPRSRDMIMPTVQWGTHTRTVLDVGCGVASFGGYLLDRNVITMSFAPKDEHEAQIQFALERGIPAFLSVIGTQKLPFPDNAFDVVHCARCRVHWYANGGKPLLELNRVLRPGGYFIWSATPVYRQEKRDQDDWNAMVTLTKSICWRTVVKSQDINGIGVVIYQKPTSNSCYFERKANEPPLCSERDGSRFPWYAPLDSCILPAPVSSPDERNNWPVLWPERLNVKYASVPDDYASNKEKFDADTKYWKQVVSEIYFNDFPLNWSSIRNIMDMSAGSGGFAAALINQPLWVMNVVPVGESDTLPVIFNRGLIGAYHDWCESFNTYPRTYDLLHMSNLLGNLTNRCDIIEVAAEIDRILRPGRWFVLKDTIQMIKKMRPILKSLHYETVIVKQQFLVATKSFWRPGKSASRSG
ncbi:probable methyltransferase PMT23 isoform X2 [Phragmites australis]|uniref:probable methyltransferase PMT23 isoform X2 n=1 Tax=Phragmites australis TaxID=29695 RepID=UPI002D77E823|nr:probable methyltransferase PMT23 isoform X2 [Phragmites australis]